MIAHTADTMEPVRRIHVDLLTCQQNNQLHRLLHSMQCNVALGTAVLVIGVIITVVSLKDYENDSKVFLVGPVLMTVGLLGMTRAVVNHFKEQNGRLGRDRRQRRLRGNSSSSTGRHVSTTGCQTSQVSQRQESESAICLGPSVSEYDDFGLMNHASLSSSFADEPPPYDAVASDGAPVMGPHANLALSLPSLPPYDEGLANPGLDLTYEPMAPPPAYEEIMCGGGQREAEVSGASVTRPTAVSCVAVPVQLPAYTPHQQHGANTQQQQQQQSELAQHHHHHQHQRHHTPEQQYSHDTSTTSVSQGSSRESEPSPPTSSLSSPSHSTSIKPALPTSPSGKHTADCSDLDDDDDDDEDGVHDISVSMTTTSSHDGACSLPQSPESPISHKGLSAGNRATGDNPNDHTSYTCISETTAHKVGYDAES